MPYKNKMIERYKSVQDYVYEYLRQRGRNTMFNTAVGVLDTHTHDFI